MTQLESARKGMVTPEMKVVAEAEGLDADAQFVERRDQEGDAGSRQLAGVPGHGDGLGRAGTLQAHARMGGAARPEAEQEKREREPQGLGSGDGPG